MLSSEYHLYYESNEGTMSQANKLSNMSVIFSPRKYKKWQTLRLDYITEWLYVVDIARMSVIVDTATT